MHPALERFIEDGERELEGLEEPARTIRAAGLHKELLRRFQPSEDAEFDGNPLHEPPSDKDVEDLIIQDHYDREDNRDAAVMAEEGCYKDDGSEREPRLSHMGTLGSDRLFPKIIVRGPDKDLMLEDGLAADLTIHDPVELVDAGEIDLEEKGHVDYKPTKSYQERVSRFMSNRAWEAQRRAHRPDRTCLRCGQSFQGRKGQKFCPGGNCRKRAHEENKIVTR